MAFGALRGSMTGAVNNVTATLAASTGGPVAVQAGDLIIAAYVEQSNTSTISAVNDALSNSYTALTVVSTAGTSIRCRTFWARASAAGSLTSVTSTQGASTNNAALAVLVVEGPFAAAPLDTAPANNINTDNASPFTCPSTGTLAQADEVVICWMGRAPVPLLTATSPNIKGPEIVSQAICAMTIGYQLVAATTAVAPAWTGTNPTASVQGTASFKKAPPPGPGTRMFQVF